MSPELMQVLMAAMSLWGVAMAIKAISALRAHRLYTFAMWDGGMLRAGKSLNPRGTKLRVVLGAALALSGLGWASHLVAMQDAFTVIVTVCVISLVTSFAHEAAPASVPPAQTRS